MSTSDATDSRHSNDDVATWICPECATADTVEVQVSLFGRLIQSMGQTKLVSVNEKSPPKWNLDSPARCTNCNYEGRLIDFEAGG